MSVRLNPYLSFRDNAREAMEFYRSVFGGELRVNTFKEYNASSDPSEDDLVMHAQLEGEHGVVFMGSDTPQRMEYKPRQQLLDVAQRRRRGGAQRLVPEAGRRRHGDHAAGEGDVGRHLRHVVDRFGVNWLVNISGSAAWRRIRRRRSPRPSGSPAAGCAGFGKAGRRNSGALNGFHVPSGWASRSATAQIDAGWWPRPRWLAMTAMFSQRSPGVSRQVCQCTMPSKCE